jgi:hypothetical protein
LIWNWDFTVTPVALIKRVHEFAATKAFCSDSPDSFLESSLPVWPARRCSNAKFLNSTRIKASLINHSDSYTECLTQLFPQLYVANAKAAHKQGWRAEKLTRPARCIGQGILESGRVGCKHQVCKKMSKEDEGLKEAAVTVLALNLLEQL